VELGDHPLSALPVGKIFPYKLDLRPGRPKVDDGIMKKKISEYAGT
jgi:hypothetical protein